MCLASGYVGFACPGMPSRGLIWGVSAYRAGMEGPGSSMTASVGEHHHDVGPGNSSSVLSKSVRGGDGEGARGEKKRKGSQGTAETKKKSRQDRSVAARPKEETEARKRGADWSEVDTAGLLQVYAEISPDKGRFRRSNGSFWEAISHKVPGRSEKECRRRMETLTKSSKAIMTHLENLGLMQLDEAILQGIPSSKLATSMTVGWYNQMCEIKKGPGNARVVVSRGTGPVEEGDQSLAACPIFATASLKVCLFFLNVSLTLMMPAVLHLLVRNMCTNARRFDDGHNLLRD